MYRLWNATPELFTSFAKMPSACRDLTNFAVASVEPDTVTLSALLWQAGTTSGGQRDLVSSHVRPKMDKSILQCATFYIHIQTYSPTQQTQNKQTAMRKALNISELSIF
jgi:hypothetical protein